jgi:hypothetical protein
MYSAEQEDKIEGVMIDMTDNAGRMVATLAVVLSMLALIGVAEDIGAWLEKDDYVDRLLAECELLETRPIESPIGMLSLKYVHGTFKCGSSIRTGAMIPR